MNYCKKSESRDISGIQVHEISKNKPLTMAGALTLLAAYIPKAQEIVQYIKDYKKMMSPKDEYWHCVREYIYDTVNYESIGLFSNPQMLVGWVNTRQLWIDKTDRHLCRITSRPWPRLNEIVDIEYNATPQDPSPPQEQAPSRSPQGAKRRITPR